MNHDTAHPCAGQTVNLTLPDPRDPQDPAGRFRIEDWNDRVFGNGRWWGVMDGNPTALKYAVRAAAAGLPTDNEVLYGKDERGLAHLVHVSELETPA